RELATLRAIGFSQESLFIAILVEVLLLASACALCAVLTAQLVLPTHEIQSTSGALSVGFKMAITPQAVGLTLIYTLLLGVAAALTPAWRTLTAPLVASLAKE
ncbi:MAG: FtsX-like permease family protein, partial [Lysobacteraceae bacterium]